MWHSWYSEETLVSCTISDEMLGVCLCETSVLLRTRQ